MEFLAGWIVAMVDPVLVAVAVGGLMARRSAGGALLAAALAWLVQRCVLAAIGGSGFGVLWTPGSAGALLAAASWAAGALAWLKWRARRRQVRDLRVSVASQAGK